MKIQYARFRDSVKLANKETLHAVVSDFEIAILPKIGCVQLKALGGKQAGDVVVVPMSNVLYFRAEDVRVEEGKPEVEQAKAEGPRVEEVEAESEQEKVDGPKPAKPSKPKPAKPKPSKAVAPGETE